MEFLQSRSRSQGWFKMSVDVCQDVIFSVCPITSAHYLLNRPIILTKLCMVVYYHEPMCHAGKLVHYLQCQSDREGLYNQNMTIFTVSSKLQIQLQPNWFDIQHHKPECPVVNWDYCIQGQGYSEGSTCQWMFVWMIFSESQNILLPNVVWWCSIMSQSVMWKVASLCSMPRSQRGLI